MNNTDYEIKCRIFSLHSICSFIPISALTIVSFIIFCSIINHNWYKLRFFILLCCLSIALISCHHPNNKTADQQAEDGWEYLFDGKTTGGWKGFQQETLPKAWVVEEGNLLCLGKGGDIGGDIITVKEYEDFELCLEWAISEGGNSGIFFHVLEEGYPTVYATGPEYQIIDDDGFPTALEEWQKSGANYAMHNASNKVLKPAGEFNSSRIIVIDGTVEHWLNGNKVLEYELWTDEWKALVQNSKWKDYPLYGTARNGHIGLQDHGDAVKFREIKIKDLTDHGKPLYNGEDLNGWKIHGTEKWFVENEDIVCESGPDEEYGYLATTSVYKDFILRLKFKQESNGNSGVFFRSGLDGTKITGWQVEVAPQGNDSGGIYESYGRGWLYRIPEDREHILKEGDWNAMVIKVEGDRVMVWLNNELMTDLNDEKIGQATGVIALQIHDGGGVKVRWKDIFLRELE